MKYFKWTAIFLVIYIPVLFFYYRKSRLEQTQTMHKNESALHVENLQTSVVQVISPNVTLIKDKKITASVSKKIEGLKHLDYAKIPKRNEIEFDIIDGYAVAYGDVLLGKPDSDFNLKKGMTEVIPPQLWERGEVPYFIQPDLPNKKRVEKAIDYFNENTGIRFTPYQGQKDAVVFEVGGEHCLSALGRVGGHQPIKLSLGCETQEILHEIMHALGFVHEQSRPDRDRFIEIEWQNIEEKYQSQFAIVPESFFESIRHAPFDYLSIMIYKPTAFAISEDKLTMRALGENKISPVHVGLSEIDKQKIKMLYPFN